MPRLPGRRGARASRGPICPPGVHGPRASWVPSGAEASAQGGAAGSALGSRSLTAREHQERGAPRALGGRGNRGAAEAGAARPAAAGLTPGQRCGRWAAPLRGAGRLRRATVTTRDFKPGGYTRRSRCFPPRKEEGGRAPRHPETSGKKKTKHPSRAAGCLQGAQGHLAPSARCPGGRGPRAGRSPGAHLARGEDGPCRQRAAAGRPAVPLPGTGARGCRTRTQAGRPREGSVDRTDSGRWPEPLSLHSEARPRPEGAWVLAPLPGLEPRL